MKIAYLASQQTLPGASRRRADAIEHDQMMTALATAFESSGDSIQAIAWNDNSADWQSFDAAIIGSTWDYCDRHEEFLNATEHIESVTQLFNSTKLIRWNSDKRYLRELESNGVNIVPTHWLDDPQQEVDWDAVFNLMKSETLVVKRQVGANAEGQFLLRRGETAPRAPHALMVQPFMSSIQQEGEYSFIFVDNQLSHALLKTPIAGDYRIQSSYGGSESVVSPSAQEIATAKSVLETLDEMPLYARVDMIRGDDDELLLMELELIEPFLYPLQGPEIGTMMHTALQKRI